MPEKEIQDLLVELRVKYRVVQATRPMIDSLQFRLRNLVVVWNGIMLRMLFCHWVMTSHAILLGLILITTFNVDSSGICWTPTSFADLPGKMRALLSLVGGSPSHISRWN